MILEDSPEIDYNNREKRKRAFMALETLEKLLKQADRLSPNEQLLLATRLIERVRQVNKPMTGKDLLNSGLVGMWAKRKDIGDSTVYAQKLRTQAQTRRRAS
ncbi:MAG TPA: hypothetical protein VIN60_04740 [Anaerolineales bacterium]